MNSIEWVAMFLNLLTACNAQPSMEQTHNGETYQVREWTCTTQQGHTTVRGWLRQCDHEQVRYWGRMYFLEVGAPFHTAIYMNRFGEMQLGQGAQKEEAYVTPCGS